MAELRTGYIGVGAMGLPMALNLRRAGFPVAFVTGRGEHLPRLGDPLSVVNGQVRPPATYLNAEEILQRQYVAHLVDQLMGESQPAEPDLDGLEQEMLGMLSRGMSNVQIADRLFMSDTTVKRRLRVVFAKLGVSRRAEAVGEAARRGLLPPREGGAREVPGH